MRILRDYAITTYAETFMKRGSDSLTNDITQLRSTTAEARFWAGIGLLVTVSK
jgi:hypothetical protein